MTHAAGTGPAPDDAAPLAPPVGVVRSTRARRVSVRVDRVTGAVRVTLPQRAPASEVGRALVRHRRWIAARQAEAAAVRAQHDARGNTVAIWGEVFDCEPVPGRKRLHAASARLLLPGDPAGAQAALERWVRARARDELTPRTQAAASTLERPLRAVKIGDARTRWGSCSSRQTISFSWRLALAPPWVAEAIVWHEACHLVHMNHSAAFWRLLRAHEPRTDEARAWLRAHGAGLLLPDFNTQRIARSNQSMA